MIWHNGYNPADFGAITARPTSEPRIDRRSAPIGTTGARKATARESVGASPIGRVTGNHGQSTGAATARPA